MPLMSLGEAGEAAPVQPAPNWRHRPPSSVESSTQISAARWRGGGSGISEFCLPGSPDNFTLGLPLRQIEGTLYVAGREAFRGRAFPGWAQVTPPNQPARIELNGPYDQLHLFIPRAVLQRCHEESFESSAPSD